MTKLVIQLPYTQAEKLTPIWAFEEAQIDFRNDPKRANRCTTAFAAMELKSHLNQTLVRTDIHFAEHAPTGDCWIISLETRDPGSKSCDFRITPLVNGVHIQGSGRTGTLYGAYEFLRLQGWRWHSPFPHGTIAPRPQTKLFIPEADIQAGPALDGGRGFDFEQISRESDTLLLWMARNRLNVASYRPATGSFAQKLGMHFKTGGHIFESILDPHRPTADGRILWEAHPEWFGLPPDGERRIEDAHKTQFCVSQPELIDFLGQELVERLMDAWQHDERIDIWTFDTWGKTCACDQCQQLGNSSDQTLYLLSQLRCIINQAQSDGRLDHSVQLIMCAYEGTATLQPPQNPLPQNLVEAGDLIVYYPINRCYAHDFTDPACPKNQTYARALQTWCALSPGMPVIVGEYYNVSRFEDLPLLFTRRIAADLPTYRRIGASGITYMHVPMVCWGIRTLTQLLYAQLAWDSETDVLSYLEDYFSSRYGPYASLLRRAYQLVEEAWCFISQWRAWDADSLLSQMLDWDGNVSQVSFHIDEHHRPGNATPLEMSRQSVSLLEEALELLTQTWRQCLQDTAEAPAEHFDRFEQYELRLSEDRRLIHYGLDVMELMTEILAYQFALMKEDYLAIHSSWDAIEQTAERLDDYTVTIEYANPGVGVQSRDGLTRSQLRKLVHRCRRIRHQAP